MLIDNVNGNYRFLPGIKAYSSGVVAMPGHEVVHVTLRRPVPYDDGFGMIDAHLRSENRRRSALCAIEMRIGRPLTSAGFDSLNERYHDLLRQWEVLVEGHSPIARTNVAPLVGAPEKPSLYGFAYTAPGGPSSPTFVVAGAAELRGLSLDPKDLIRRGEMTADAMREKATWVMTTMRERLRGLGADWPDVTSVNIYTAHSIDGFLTEAVLGKVGVAGIHGVRWHVSRPPIVGLEFEMDVRGIARDLVLD